MSNLSRRRRTRYVGKHRTVFALAALLGLCFTSAGDLTAQKQIEKGSQTSESAETRVRQRDRGSSNREIVIGGRTLHVPDVSVVTQDGKRLRFFSDLIKDKSVAIGFFFTSCLSVCTAHGKLFSGFQEHLAGRLGKEIFLISVSMDPVNDTPARLKRWGAKYDRKPGWTLVTGGEPEMNDLLRSMTGDKTGPQEVHSSFFYIYNGKTGRWSFISGYPTPSEFAEQIEELGKGGTSTETVSITSADPQEISSKPIRPAVLSLVINPEKE